MDNDVVQRGFLQTQSAISRLAEAADIWNVDPSNELVRDALIQRFEFSFELLWKLFRKVHIVIRGVERSKVRAAYECIAEAGAAGWLGNRTVWEAMRTDRNFTSHEYDMHASQEVAERIAHTYTQEMEHVLHYLKSHYIDTTPMHEWRDRDNPASTSKK